MASGSKEFCFCARHLNNSDKKIYESYLTKETVESMGDYIVYLTNYLLKFGVDRKLRETCEIFLQNQIYSLSLDHKKYIEDELIILKRYNICPRIVDRILSQIQGHIEPKILYKKYNISDVNLLKNTVTEGANYKFYPF